MCFQFSTFLKCISNEMNHPPTPVTVVTACRLGVGVKQGQTESGAYGKYFALRCLEESWLLLRHRRFRAMTNAGRLWPGPCARTGLRAMHLSRLYTRFSHHSVIWTTTRFGL